MKKQVGTGVAVAVFFVLSILCVGIVVAEQSASGSDASSPIAFNGAGPALPMDIVKARISMYENMLISESATDSDRATIQSLLAYYGKIKSALEGKVSETYYREITHQLFDGMLLLENSFLAADNEPTESEVLNVEREWIQAFNTLDFDLMASLYHHAPETTSFSPNSASLYRGWDAIAEGLENYFNSPQGTYAWTLQDEKVSMLSDSMAIITGTHVVIDRPANGQEMTGKHVFTRLVRKIDGRWRIVHEHESHIPRGRG